MTAATTGAIAAMTAKMIVVTGEMTAKTGVPAPDCSVDSSKPRRARPRCKTVQLSASILSRRDPSNEGRTRSDQAHEHRGDGREPVSPLHLGRLQPRGTSAVRHPTYTP